MYACAQNKLACKGISDMHASSDVVADVASNLDGRDTCPESHDTAPVAAFVTTIWYAVLVVLRTEELTAQLQEVRRGWVGRGSLKFLLFWLWPRELFISLRSILQEPFICSESSNPMRVSH